MTRTLKLGFKNEASKEVNILLPNPKENLTKVEAVATQTMIIARNLSHRRAEISFRRSIPSY